MRAVTLVNETRGRLWRSRWAAFGAAVAVTLGAGGLAVVNAAGGVDSTTVFTDPVRVLDSRDPVNVGLPGPFASQVPQKLKVTGTIPTTTGTKIVVPDGATGVLLNVTVVAPQADGFISIRPGDATGLPTTSSLNATAGQVVPNAVLVALPTSGANAGQIDITYDAYGRSGPTTDLLIDVVGYASASKLDALQAELDALQAGLDAKANSSDVYSKAVTDQRIESSKSVAVTGAGIGLPATLTAQAEFLPETIVTPQAGQLLIAKSGAIQLYCNFGEQLYFLMVDDVPLRSSVMIVLSGGTDGQITGTTDAVIPAGSHEISIGARCSAPTAVVTGSVATQVSASSVTVLS